MTFIICWCVGCYFGYLYANLCHLTSEDEITLSMILDFVLSPITSIFWTLMAIIYFLKGFENMCVYEESDLLELSMEEFCEKYGVTQEEWEMMIKHFQEM